VPFCCVRARFSIFHKVQRRLFMNKNGSSKVATAKPKKLSKAGEWLRTHPKGLGVTINDMRAVMR